MAAVQSVLVQNLQRILHNGGNHQVALVKIHGDPHRLQTGVDPSADILADHFQHEDIQVVNLAGMFQRRKEQAGAQQRPVFLPPCQRFGPAQLFGMHIHLGLVVREDFPSVHGQGERSGDLLPFHHAFQHFPGKILQVFFFFFGAAQGNGNIPEHGVFRIVFGAQIYAEPS